MSDIDIKSRRKTEAESSPAVRSAEPLPALPLATRRRRFHIFPLLITLAVIAVAVVLGLGLWNTMQGGSPHKSQRLMRWRVLLQAIAILIVMVTIWALGR